jgi:hypothetical protein
LLDLTNEDLTKLGISIFGHQKVIIFVFYY